MFKRYIDARRRPTLLVIAVLLSAALEGCASSEDRQRANLGRDTEICSNFGSLYGSPQHSECMLVQQQRRDNKGREAMERARISSETARNNSEALARLRCDQERRESEKRGERPRSCR